MNWAEHTQVAETFAESAKARPGVSPEAFADVAIAATHALLAINAGLEAIWQEVRKQ